MTAAWQQSMGRQLSAVAWSQFVAMIERRVVSTFSLNDWLASPAAAAAAAAADDVTAARTDEK